MDDARIDDEVHRMLAQGFPSRERIVETVVDVLIDEFPDEPEVAARVEQRLSLAQAARRREQQSWPAVTDCDRLDRAFASLERGGIVARQDFTCCMTCGRGEIVGEIDEAKARGHVEGYTFYHAQDTERAADGGTLMLAYGIPPKSASSQEDWDERMQAVATRVVEAMRAEGLAAEWDGNLDRRIEVTLHWQRRVAWL